MQIKDKQHAYLQISLVEKFIMDVGTYEEKIFLKRNNIQEVLTQKLSRHKKMELIKLII
jgi:hypothetical protein